MKRKMFVFALLAVIAAFSFSGCGASVEVFPGQVMVLEDYNSCEGLIYAPNIYTASVFLEDAYDSRIRYYASIDRYNGTYFADDFPSGLYWVVADDGYGNEVSYGPYTFWGDGFIVDVDLWL